MALMWLSSGSSVALVIGQWTPKYSILYLYLEVLEVLVGLEDLVNPGSPGVQEGPQCLFQEVLSPLYFLSSLAIQEVL